MERSEKILSAADQGEMALQEGCALVECLKEACEGAGQFHMPHIATVLEVVRERLGRAEKAFHELTAGP